jgi:hypothetical protein
MIEQKKKLTNINTQLNQISLGIDAINDDNFEASLKNVNLCIKQLEIKKANFKKTLSEQDYSYICDVVHRGVKQISTKLDSVIEKKKEEQVAISSELSKIVNEKKLINYQR